MVGITGFNEANRQQYGWLHVTCQYNYMKNITSYLHGTGGLDQNYTTSISNNPSYIPADSFDVYMGNSYQMNSGIGNILMKEVRVWGYARTFSDI